MGANRQNRPGKDLDRCTVICAACQRRQVLGCLASMRGWRDPRFDGRRSLSLRKAWRQGSLDARRNFLPVGDAQNRDANAKQDPDRMRVPRGQ